MKNNNNVFVKIDNDRYLKLSEIHQIREDNHSFLIFFGPFSDELGWLSTRISKELGHKILNYLEVIE